MKRLRNKMTTEELAECLGVAKQTVNRWIREKGWKTEKFPGVKGGRQTYSGRYKFASHRTRQPSIIQSMLMQLKRELLNTLRARAPAYRQIINGYNMTDIEQESRALLIEGIRTRPFRYWNQINKNGRGYLLPLFTSYFLLIFARKIQRC